MRKDIKASCQKRLSRIEGQVRGLSKMVDEDRYCIDIVTQISAVRAALRRVEEEVLRDHVAHCVEGADRERQQIRSAPKDFRADGRHWPIRQVVWARRSARLSAIGEERTWLRRGPRSESGLNCDIWRAQRQCP